MNDQRRNGQIMANPGNSRPRNDPDIELLHRVEGLARRAQLHAIAARGPGTTPDSRISSAGRIIELAALIQQAAGHVIAELDRPGIRADRRFKSALGGDE